MQKLQDMYKILALNFITAKQIKPTIYKYHGTIKYILKIKGLNFI
jgi:hypothetical protein